MWVQRNRDTSEDPVDNGGNNNNMDIYLSRAVLTLQNLNVGNRMVDRCKYYLDQLITLLGLQGKIFHSIHSKKKINTALI